VNAPVTLPSHEAWLAARRIGGSDVAAILGQSAYRTGWDVYARLVLGEPDFGGNDATRRGQALEPLVLREYAAATGVQLERIPPFTLFRRDEWATASVDALGRKPGGPRRIAEAKTDRDRSRWGAPCTIERWEPEHAQIVRKDYYLQGAHYMFVLDLDVVDLAVLLPGDDPFVPELRVYTLLRDRDLEAAMVDRLRSWWETHVVGRVPPELDGSDAAGRYLARRNRAGSRPATLAEVQLAAEYETAKAMANKWDAHRKLIGQRLVESAGTANRLDLPVGRVTVTRNGGRAYLDERRLVADHPELAPVLDEYRRRSDPYAFPQISGLETR